MRDRLVINWDSEPYLLRNRAGEGGLDGLREVFAHIADDVAAIGFGEFEGARGGADKTAHGAISVMHEALARRKGIKGKGDSVNNRVPARGLAAVNGIKVTLQDALAADGPQAAQMHLPDLAAGGGKLGHRELLPDGAIQGDQLAAMVVTGMEGGLVNRGEFDGDKDLLQICLDENGEALDIGNRGIAQERAGSGDADEVLHGAELLEQICDGARGVGRDRRTDANLVQNLFHA